MDEIMNLIIIFFVVLDDFDNYKQLGSIVWWISLTFLST